MLNELQLITISNWCQSQTVITTTKGVIECIKDVALDPTTTQIIMNWHPL